MSGQNLELGGCSQWGHCGGEGSVLRGLNLVAEEGRWTGAWASGGGGPRRVRNGGGEGGRGGGAGAGGGGGEKEKKRGGGGGTGDRMDTGH